jgi:hypothetical protein
MGKKVFVPYLSAALGHLILAQAIAHCLRQMRPDRDVRLMDPAPAATDRRNGAKPIAAAILNCLA